MLGVRADHSGHGSQQLTQEQDRSHKEGRHALLNLRSHFAGASDTPQTCFFLSCLARSSNLIFLWNLQSFNYTKQLENPSSLRWFREVWGGRRSSVVHLGHNTAHLEVSRTSAGRKCVSRTITDGVLIKNNKNQALLLLPTQSASFSPTSVSILYSEGSQKPTFLLRHGISAKKNNKGMHNNFLWRERTVLPALYIISQSPFHPLGQSFGSLSSLAHISCLWLSLHVCSFTTSFLWLTVALLVSQMACDTHLSQGNLCVLFCQVKQPFVYRWRLTQYLWDYKTWVFFLHFHVKIWPKFQILNH